MRRERHLLALKYGESTLPCNQLYRGGDPCLCEPISFTVYLLTVGARKILIDAGCEDMPGFQMEQFCSPVEILARCGIFPEEITDLIITHAHHDHIAAAKRFPNATAIIHIDAYARGARYLPPRMPIRTFRRSAMVARGVQVRLVGGHASGSSVVLIDQGEKTYLICGDECYVSRNFRDGIPTGASAAPAKSEAFLRAYNNSRTVPLFCHDPAILPGENGFLQIF